MSVEFQEDKSTYQSHVILGAVQTPGMVNWLTSKGIVKHKKAAFFILVSIALTSVMASGVILYLFVFPHQSASGPVQLDPAMMGTQVIYVPDHQGN